MINWDTKLHSSPKTDRIMNTIPDFQYSYGVMKSENCYQRSTDAVVMKEAMHKHKTKVRSMQFVGPNNGKCITRWERPSCTSSCGLSMGKLLFKSHTLTKHARSIFLSHCKAPRTQHKEAHEWEFHLIPEVPDGLFSSSPAFGRAWAPKLYMEVSPATWVGHRQPTPSCS